MQADRLSVKAQQSMAKAQQSSAGAAFCLTNGFFLLRDANNETDKKMFGPDSRERMAFLSFAVPWCSKARPEHSKTGPGCHLVEKGSKKRRAQV